MTTLGKIAGVSLAMILILSFSGQAQQLFLNVYVDDTSANKALVVGNVDNVLGLPFLNASNQIHQDNGQLMRSATLSCRETAPAGGWSSPPLAILTSIMRSFTYQEASSFRRSTALRAWSFSPPATMALWCWMCRATILPIPRSL